MGKAKALVPFLGVVFVFALAATSARADAFSADGRLVKMNHAEEHLSNLPETSRAGIVLTFSEIFEGNNGKHLGFSIASANRGHKFGLFKPPQTSGSGGTIPNPEPAAIFLLGTGLAAVGAYARKKFRKSSH